MGRETLNKEKVRKYLYILVKMKQICFPSTWYNNYCFNHLNENISSTKMKMKSQELLYNIAISYIVF